jgi:3-hydroxy-9,10-secoandrosta-1,3,5(10)-triene-9,17-dione monooxygenase reductase component
MTVVPQQGQWFRRVLGHFPTGVVIVTAIDDDTPVGMAIGSFTSVSLDPPLIAILPAKTSVSWPRIAVAGAFCVNVLNARQEALCRTFATTGADKFAGVPWRPSPSGAPVLEGTLAWIDCSLEQLVEAGDHYIALGRVRSLDVSADQAIEPLVFFKGGYGTIRRCRTGFRTTCRRAPPVQSCCQPAAATCWRVRACAAW